MDGGTATMYTETMSLSGGRAICALCCMSALMPVAARSQAPPSNRPGRLQIVVAEGDGAINDIRSRRAKEPVVVVQDEAGRPVSGAVVHFILPGTGAGGVFGGESSLTVTTDARGRAVGRGLRPNRVAGPFQIRVTASNRGQVASAVVRQTNVEPAAGAGKASKKIVILALIGGAIAGGALAASRGGNAAPAAIPAAAPPGTIVTPGTPVAGPPQ